MSTADLFDNAPCAFLAADSNRRIVTVNQTLADWLGCRPDDLIGQAFTDLFAAGSRMHYETHFGPLLQMKGELSGVTVDLIDGNRARIPVFVAANAKKDASGRVELFRITFVDASDRRSYERELLDARRQAELERTRAQVLAQTLQRSLLPPSLSPPQGLQARAYFHAASPEVVSGDFYDLFPLSSVKAGLFMGDVCGKGANAAAVTSMTRYTLRAAAVMDGDPVTVLQNLDAVFHQEVPSEGAQFCTVIFGTLTANGPEFDVSLASGGHVLPIVADSNGDVRFVDILGGHPIGIIPNPRFVSTRLRLAPGDTLMLYTDGLTEARTGAGGSASPKRACWISLPRRRPTLLRPLSERSAHYSRASGTVSTTTSRCWRWAYRGPRDVFFGVA